MTPQADGFASGGSGRMADWVRMRAAIRKAFVASSYVGDDIAKQKKLPPQLQAWVEARKRFHLSHAQV